MSQKAYKYLLQGGIYFSLLVVFFVFKNLLFPFITSKQISFNIIIEILAIFWVAFIVKYPSWRPKFEYIGMGIIAFFAILTLSSFTGVDFNLSFWGDVERMLGVFHLLHFLVFYFIIVTVFKDWLDWKIFFIISILFAFFVSIKGIQDNPYATIGNTLYVAGYLIFNMFFAVLLFFREKSWNIKWIYLLPIPVLFYAFIKTSSAGGLVGIAAGIFVALFLYGLLNKNNKVRVPIVSVLMLMIFLVSYIFIFNRDNYFTRTFPTINSIKNDISFEKNTFQTRLLSWKAGYKDFKNHPLLGAGHGNYAIIFDKYFDPKFYSYTSSETYFDRAHNNLIDIASTSGILGLVTYLFIFLAAAYYWIKAYLKDKISVNDFVLITALMVAYFVQNLVVFDSLVTYMALMMTLGYIYWNYHKEEDEELDEDDALNNKEIGAYVAAGIILLSILYQYNYLPYRMLDQTIAGQIAYSQGGIVPATEAYKKALSYNTVLDRDSRTSYNRLVISNPQAIASLPDTNQKKEIIDYAIELAEKNVEYNPGDSLNQMMLAQTYATAATVLGNPNMFNLALEAIDKSLEASPGRPPVYSQKAQIYINMGQEDLAIETLKYAVSLNEDYPDSSCNLARALFYFKEEEEGYKYMDICLDKNGIGVLAPASLVKALINHYAEAEDYSKLSQLYLRLTQLEPNVSENYIRLATIYKNMLTLESDTAVQDQLREKSKNAALKAGELDPKIQGAVDNFISDL